jgi:hypothetical protein
MGTVALALALLAGCSKKAEQPPTAAPPTAGNAAPPAAASAERATARPVNAANSADASAALAAADAALKARQYEQAVRNLLAIQAQKNLSEQQALAARDQMVQLQRGLAGAVANGDPKAIAAAELLRASARH